MGVKNGFLIKAVSGWAEANFLWGATVNSEKGIFKNSLLLNKSPKDGGNCLPVPPGAPLEAKSRSGTYLLDQTRRSNFKDFMAVSIVYILTT